MTEERCWLALVTFERRDADQEILPEWAHGACGWLIAIAPDAEEARRRLIRDVERAGLRVLEIDNEREVLGEDEVAAIDGHLAANLKSMEAETRTIWGTIHGYKGEGEA